MWQHNVAAVEIVVDGQMASDESRPERNVFFSSEDVL
jgi:hypothetical protein